jgi:hypothetical protein
MPESTNGEFARPRIVWLAIFQVIVIALVVLLARESRTLSGPPMLEDQLGTLSESPGAIAPGPWGGRGWLAALVAMGGALLLMLPVAWTYVATRLRREVDQSVVTTIILLPIAVAAILVIVQDSLAVAFSLAGIAGLVRFRNALDDTRDAMYVVIAIAVGLGAGVGTLEASATLTGLYDFSVVALWKWSTARPVIADIALGEETVPRGGSVIDALRPKPGDRHPDPAAEWFEPGKSVALADGTEPLAAGPGKREGILRVHASDDVPTRRSVEAVLEAHAKRWSLESDDPGPDGLPTLTYSIKLKKRSPPEALLEGLRERLGPRLAEYTSADGRPPVEPGA